MISPKNFVDSLFEDDAPAAPGMSAKDLPDTGPDATDAPDSHETQGSRAPDGRPSMTDILTQMKASGKADTSDEFLDAFIADYYNAAVSNEEFCQKYGCAA
jgi:hypothetical protein